MTSAAIKQNFTKFISSKIITLLFAIGLGVTFTSGASANPKYAGIVIDAKTGRTLYKYKADSKRYPASLTKMMTLYLIFEALETGKVKKSTRIRVSKNAAAEEPSKLGLKAGQTITIEQVIYALVTKSANDAATAVGEFLGGSEANFGRLMTAKARSLKMSSTTFRNAHGLPNKRQVTTARDMARLGIALREHYPQYYKYFSTRSFRYGKANYGNHNRLLGRVKGVDGIKTGYTRASGFNLTSSVRANGRSIVAVVMGGKSGASRNAQMQKLISQYLRKASRSGKGGFYAKTRLKGLVPSVKTASVSPKNVPVPVITSYSAQPVVVASAAPKPSITAPKAPLPVASPGVDSIKTASTKLPKGWSVQVGAAQSQNDALGLLANIKKKGGSTLSGTEAYTMAFVKDGQQYYRARFGGFNGQDHAVSTCKSLKKKGISCWASAM
ncbi:serine hydrolase [Lentilitoribacter sp. EG35]|uniref:serine hydrolase n=1 Tax=Lentilitoribacter sp. EG35 TaxID=3234192 RepID=UPI003460FAF8